MNLQTMARIDLRGSSQRGPSTERRTDVGSPRGELTPTGKGKSASSRGVLLLISIRHHGRPLPQEWWPTQNKLQGLWRGEGVILILFPHLKNIFIGLFGCFDFWFSGFAGIGGCLRFFFFLKETIGWVER